ncbi:MAG: RluA family pseudouridine synthase [Alphaproteobacteria bacterium]
MADLNEQRPNEQRHYVAATAKHKGERLDKLLAAALPALSRTRLKNLIEAGRVACAGATITDASRRVKPGEIFEIVVPPPVPAEPRAQNIPLAIVYEDEDLIVIDKPAGLVVHPAPGNRDNTLVNALLAHCGKSLSGIGGVMRPGIVHRLDKDTSGLMVVAKNDAAHASLARQFAERTMSRAYYAVVWGVPRKAEGEISGNIGRNPHFRKKMAVVKSGGKPALTRYKVLRSFGKMASLIECRLMSGRTHQIRVHMAAIGHPVIGDTVYGGKSPPGIKLDPALATAAKHLGRQALHAYLIGFDHPRTGERLEFQSNITSDINMLIELLEKS